MIDAMCRPIGWGTISLVTKWAEPCVVTVTAAGSVAVVPSMRLTLTE